MTPEVLATADLVVTTYDVVTQELTREGHPDGPIGRVRWHRHGPVVLHSAQRVLGLPVPSSSLHIPVLRSSRAKRHRGGPIGRVKWHRHGPVPLHPAQRALHLAYSRLQQPAWARGADLAHMLHECCAGSIAGSMHMLPWLLHLSCTGLTVRLLGLQDRAGRGAHHQEPQDAGLQGRDGPHGDPQVRRNPLLACRAGAVGPAFTHLTCMQACRDSGASHCICRQQGECLTGACRWCLTGTPCVNRPLDFFALFCFLEYRCGFEHVHACAHRQKRARMYVLRSCLSRVIS